MRLLQEPDGQVLHQVAITLLSRQFGGAVAPDAYLPPGRPGCPRYCRPGARQGGKVFLLNPSIDGPEDSGPVSAWTEPSLMPCLDAYLQRQYWRSLDRPPNSLWLVIDTS